jgi:hypothetical protein
MGGIEVIIKNILIGEDIRQEIGNKISLMGILGSVLNIDVSPNVPKEMPVTVSLAYLISIEKTNPAIDPKDFSIQISMSTRENKLGSITARIQSTGEDRLFNLPVPRFQFPVTENTRLSVHVQVMKNDTQVSEHTAILDINLNRGTGPQKRQRAGGNSAVQQ